MIIKLMYYAFYMIIFQTVNIHVSTKTWDIHKPPAKTKLAI